ncbi:PQ loop repeat-domain-containing protein [Roridomyces roridus]|uniref:PQ loop repeat-domain-containing protein n=1 Tax=Roridomyces roridus TaxID=1738132 RepID=A0AAD7CB28_9AGAR|nr:PQ loop repeat-domain-containing protein [Roridomyces roridus]
MLDGDFSSMLGWISIASWVVVYTPQIYENYTLQSGEGLSVLFVIVWLCGDICNLAGAALGRLLPTVIILAVYYSICDIILMFQIYFYRWKRVSGTGPDEETPLLNRNGGSPAPVSVTALVLRYIGALLFVFATGVLAWWISSNTGYTQLPPKSPPSATVSWIIQILGWTSAVCYLGSRLPQIAKNFRTRCEGLSPALFYFAILGNVTYSWSIIAKSTERDYLITNAAWLAGSALTVGFDLTVLGQFFYYRSVRLRQNAGIDNVDRN